MKGKIQFVEASGSNYDIGYEHGSQCRDKIKLLTDNLLHEAVTRTNLSKEQVYQMAIKYIPYFEAEAPHLIEEIKGIAEGAALPYKAVLLLNLRHEFMYGIRTMQSVGCTSVGITKERSATGNVIVAQNVDLPPSFMGLMSLFHLKPETGPTILMYALVGTVGHHGINSYGLARSSNAIASKHEKALGVSRVILNRIMLEQKSVDDVIEAIGKAERAVSGNYMLADATGKLIDVETTAEEYRILYPNNGIIVHANHIVHPDLIEISTNVSECSTNRYIQINKLTSKHKGKVDIENIKTWLRNHTGYPNSVCNHTTATSIASIICQPTEGEILVCSGTPCKNEYYKFSL